MNYNVAIIGAGLIGRKRATALSKFSNCSLQITVDLDKDRARSLAQDFGGGFETDWKKAIIEHNIDIVIVSVVNKYLSPITKFALQNGKHVLCEKPLGRKVQEAQEIMQTLMEQRQQAPIILKTGFNHRHHPAISKAKELFNSGTIGKLHFIRCRYGHGGRPGYDKEWRMDKDLCGGGELLDQGVHVVDLCRYFSGDFVEAFGYVPTYFWDTLVEDNAFAMLKTSTGIVATMHTSWTQWKNIFSMEIFGEKGYLTINGLGGSYGAETLTIGTRMQHGGVPKEKTITFDEIDISWEEEWKEFVTAIEENREPLGGGLDGYKANCIIQAIYESARTKKATSIINQYEDKKCFI